MTPETGTAAPAVAEAPAPRLRTLRFRGRPAPVAPPPAILCEGVVKRFYRYEHRSRTLREMFIRTVMRRPVHVRRAEFSLTGLNLRIEQGESVALIGANGSGKSTALRILAGVYQPTEGQVMTCGRVAAIIALGVGFHPELTGAENLRQYAAVMGIPPGEAAARYERIVEFADIGAFIDEPLKYYSSGMAARLAFAAATQSQDPDILLVDEVLSVGDQAFRRRGEAYMHRFRADGGTLVVVTHSMDEVLELCDRAVWLDHGRVVMDGATHSVVPAYLSGQAPETLA